MLTRNNIRHIQSIGFLLFLITLFSILFSYQINSYYSKQLNETHLIVDNIYLEAGLIQDKLNETLSENNIKPRAAIVIRIDDVSSYTQETFSELFEYHLANEIPASLGVISSFVENNKVLLEMLNIGAQHGLEICSHGWEHANFSKYNLEEQIWRLNQSKTVLDKLIGVNSSVFIPPYFEFNHNSILAMNKTGFSIISANLGEKDSFLVDKIQSFSATVSFSRLERDKWIPRTKEFLIMEIVENVEKYGYAVLLTHPQEFLKDGQVDYQYLSSYIEFINLLNKTYQFTTFSELQSSPS